MPIKVLALVCAAGMTLALFTPSAPAASTINATNRYAYAANLGWVDWRGDTTNGAVIGEYVCAGSIYGANVGWISLGNGAPTNGIHYQNLSASDFGVNHDGFGNLRGYAYGANIGWVNFEASGAPKVNLKTGKMSGAVYSANCGWIGLSNALAVVQSDRIPGGVDSDGNGLADAWERLYFGSIGVSPGADADGDGVSNKAEYLAGTNPTDASSKLVITAFHATPSGGLVDLTWQSVTNRCYFIQKRPDLTVSTWFDSGLGVIEPDGASTTRIIMDTNLPMRFYRVGAFRPLAP